MPTESGQVSSLAKIPALQRAGADRSCACDWRLGWLDRAERANSARGRGGSAKGGRDRTVQTGNGSPT